MSRDFEPEQESAALEAAESGAPGSRSLLGAAMLGSSATVIVGLLGVGRTKVLAVELDPAGLGLYGQILTLLMTFSAVSGLGLGLGTTRLVAEARTHDDPRGLKQALEVSFALPFAVASALALVVAACSAVLASLLLDDDRAVLIVLAALAIPGVAIQGPLIHALQGFRDVAGAQASNVFFGVTLTLASVIGVLAGGLEGAVVGLVVGNALYAVALAWRLRQLLRRAGVTLSLRAGLRLERLRDRRIQVMLGIGFASLFVGVSSTLAELGVRTFVLRDEGADAAGIFQALQLISVQFVAVIVAAVVFLSFTAITEAHAASDRALVRRTVDDTLRLTLLLVLPVLLALALLRSDVVRVFLSGDFDRAGDLLPRQLAGDFFRTAAWVLGAALVPLGMTRMWMLVTSLTVAGYVAAAAVLIPSYGLDGAVDAYVVEWGVAAALSVCVLASRGFLGLSGLTWRVVAGGAVAVAVILALPEPARGVGVLITAAFVLVLLMAGTSRPERAALLARLRGFAGR